MQGPIRSSVSAIKSAIAEIVGIDIAAEIATDRSTGEKFRLAFETCPSALVMADGAGIIVFANAETARLFGYRREELAGRPFEMLVPERLHGDCLRERAGALRHPEGSRPEKSRIQFGLTRDGVEFPVEVRFSPIHSGRECLLLYAIADAGERIRADRLKDEFVSTVSHELRTPLTSISGSLGLLIGGAAGKLPDQAMRLIGIAQNNSQRLVRLINDILDIEKIESGAIVFHFRRLDARSLAEQAIEANRGFADGFNVRIRLASDTVAAEEVYADSDRLVQVITNLLSNAIRFSPSGEEVIVTVGQRPDAVRISVRDRGPGIPVEFRPRMFKKFAQADAGEARRKGGTGLGLNIVKQIVGRLNGRVGFEDAAGGGTVFHVDLPPWSAIEQEALDPDRGPQDTRVLLCEDDPDAATALREGLRATGFSIDFAHNPADSVARAQRGCYAAVVVDLDLPDGGGLSLVRRLREQPEIYKTPIVVLSAGPGADKSGRNETSDLDRLEWIEKPANTDQLAQILDRAIRRGTIGRPHILHVDDDADVLDLVASTLAPTANVTSAGSIEEARRALSLHQFDLAVLDMTLDPGSGFELLPDLRRRNGTPIPVIIFSAHAGEHEANPQVETTLTKSRASLDRLVAAVHDRLMLKSPEEAR